MVDPGKTVKYLRLCQKPQNYETYMDLYAHEDKIFINIYTTLNVNQGTKS